jgi:hypothetical protein
MRLSESAYLGDRRRDERVVVLQLLRDDHDEEGCVSNR